MSGLVLVALLALLGSSLASPPQLATPWITPKGSSYLRSPHQRLHQPAMGPEDLFIPSQDHNSKIDSCLECAVALGTLQAEIEVGMPYEWLVQEAITICITLVGYTEVFCEGYVPMIAPVLYHIFTTTNVTSSDACGEILTYLGCTTSNPAREWTVNIQGEKPPVLPLSPPEPGTSTLTVLHLTDPHYDPLYMPGSNAACPEELCCRNDSGVVESPGDEAWYWGDYRHCGSPAWLLEDMLTHARDTFPNLDYVIWTGDMVPHNMWSTSIEWNLRVVRETTQMIRSFFPNIPVFPVVGNHEMNPVDQFPDPDDDDEELGEMSADWLYAELSEQWSHLVPNLDNSTVKRAAYYSVLLQPGFRLISFNTMLGYTGNMWLVENSQDPGGELAWLERELFKAEEAGELVHLLGHVPPGTIAAERTWSREYNRLVIRYENTIRAQFFGHTHYDELEIFHDELGRPAGVAYISPSQTPWFDLNPAYRVYHIDGDRQDSTRLVLDHETYAMNLTEAQVTGAARWFKLYGARDLYEMPSLTPADWQHLVERMAEDRTLFDLYFRNYVSGGDPYLLTGCDDLCYEQRLCDIVTSSRNQMDSCMAILRRKRRG